MGAYKNLLIDQQESKSCACEGIPYNLNAIPDLVMSAKEAAIAIAEIAFAHGLLPDGPAYNRLMDAIKRVENQG